MMNKSGLDDEHYVYEQLFTSTFHHDVYPSIDPLNPYLSQENRTLLIFGATGGIGPVNISIRHSHHVATY
jgi:hypothetical protein